MNALFDTCILIDYLNGVAAAKKELGRYERHAISIVTWMEVMCGATPDLTATTRSYLSGFDVLPIDEGIAERAVGVRRERRLKLPDAIILATALQTGLTLVTRNSKDFGQRTPGVRIPYRV